MGTIIDGELVEPAVRALLGAIDAGDGGTSEQRAVLSALVRGYWQRPDLDVGSLTAMPPSEIAAAIPGPGPRRRLRELMVVLELCRHPQTDAQVQRTDAYADALGEAGPGLALARSTVRDGSARAMADFSRFYQAARPAWAEPSLIDRYLVVLDEPDLELAARLRALHDLPEGTLGHEYVEFYRRHGITLPGEDPNSPAFFVGHDMDHVIAGYGTTGEGEVCLAALLLGMDDSDDHWVLFLTSLTAYELGLLSTDTFEGKTGVLARPGMPDMLAEALRRGGGCTADFSAVDHLALAHLPLSEVRERFGVPPLVGRSS